MKRKAIFPAMSGLFLAMALLLPFITASDPKLGSVFLPMHIPVMLCGFICGPFWGLVIGAVAPLLRSMLFSAPILYPSAVIMCAELATYGLICGLLQKHLHGKLIPTYAALIGAMVGGRIVWGIASFVIQRSLGNPFGWQAFFGTAFVTAIPGIILQLVIVPPLAKLVAKYIKQ